jgi:hypothetical protein
MKENYYIKSLFYTMKLPFDYKNEAHFDYAQSQFSSKKIYFGNV